VRKNVFTGEIDKIVDPSGYGRAILRLVLVHGGSVIHKNNVSQGNSVQMFYESGSISGALALMVPVQYVQYRYVVYLMVWYSGMPPSSC
jgi:hypothetical protein